MIVRMCYLTCLKGYHITYSFVRSSTLNFTHKLVCFQPYGKLTGFFTWTSSDECSADLERTRLTPLILAVKSSWQYKGSHGLKRQQQLTRPRRKLKPRQRLTIGQARRLDHGEGFPDLPLLGQAGKKGQCSRAIASCALL